MAAPLPGGRTALGKEALVAAFTARCTFLSEEQRDVLAGRFAGMALGRKEDLYVLLIVATESRQIYLSESQRSELLNVIWGETD